MIKVIETNFALVSSGNCTKAWIIDGDDVQTRANELINDYWHTGRDVKIYENNTHGFAVIGPQHSDLSSNKCYFDDIFYSRESAEREATRLSEYK